MSDIICVTNRTLCREDFAGRVEKIAKQHPKGILLREKDLSETEYLALAKKVLAICQKYQTPCILHSFVDVAMTLKHPAIHLPLPLLRTLDAEKRAAFTVLGASCHSVAEAQEAEQLGCTYLVAGHIFETDCKKGLAGRGLDFLQEVCKHVAIPVYGIGGIDAENIGEVRKAGASGGCIMSGIMTCDAPEEYLKGFAHRRKRNIERKSI